jgi:hypothetical protein
MQVRYGVPVDELILVIKNAIKRANLSSVNKDRDLQVTAVFLKLNTIATVSAGGGLDFRIPVLGMKLKIGGSVTRQDTHVMEMTLIPDAVGRTHEIRDGGAEAVLVEAIEMLRTVIARAAEGDDPFILKDSSVELAFAVSEDGTISLGVEGELRNEITHTMRLSLAAAAPSET